MDYIMNTRESFELFINNFSFSLEKSIYTQWEHHEFLCLFMIMQSTFHHVLLLWGRKAWDISQYIIQMTLLTRKIISKQ